MFARYTVAVAVERSRHVEVEHLARVRNLADVEHRAIVAVRHFFRIFHDLVDEVAKVQHEAELRRPARARPPRSSVDMRSARLH